MEAEFGIVLGSDIDPAKAEFKDIIDGIASVHPVIEIHNFFFGAPTRRVRNYWLITLFTLGLSWAIALSNLKIKCQLIWSLFTMEELWIHGKINDGRMKSYLLSGGLLINKQKEEFN